MPHVSGAFLQPRETGSLDVYSTTLRVIYDRLLH